MILIGDATEKLKTLADASVHCCVTSPPYYGLRDYGHAGQIGLEETPEAYVAKLVEVFREVRRVLRDDGTLWLNLGDSYSGYKGDNYGKTKGNLTARTPVATDKPLRTGTPQTCGLGNKQLLGIPWRVAFSLQADGWILRQDIIWHKPAPMPESVKDRCTKSHEYLFLLAKSQRYYFDSDAIKEKATGRTVRNNGHKYTAEYESSDNELMRTKAGLARLDGKVYESRNRRSVWAVATKPFKGAHFATFPPGLIEPCIQAGSPSGGTVLDPFGGSGTTGQVAQALGREFILIELNPAYESLIRKRLGPVGLFNMGN